MSKIKICGMQAEEDILAANKALPDFVGFIFVDWDRHYITEDQAKKFKSLLSPKILAVGAFVDAPIETVTRLLNDNIIDVAQLHGNEDENYVQAVMEKTHKPVINATGVKSPDDIKRIISTSADYILLDAPGGCTGTTFDWSLISNINRPYFLAGGLNVDNIQIAIRRFQPFAVDLSSGAETDGKKDPAKMMKLVELVREAS